VFQPTGADLATMGLNAMDPQRRGPVTKQARDSARRKLERAEVRELVSLFSTASTSAR
jgi:hypothetical protein